MASSSTEISCPDSDLTPYPLGTTYLQTVASFLNLTSQVRVPVAILLQMSSKSESSAVRTFIASGSPNLALISMIFGPSTVSMNCPYITPR